MNGALIKYLNYFKASSHYNVISKKTKIVGNECWSDPTEALERVSAEEIAEAIVKTKLVVEQAYASLASYNIHIENEVKLDENTQLVTKIPIPKVRQGTLVLVLFWF